MHIVTLTVEPQQTGIPEAYCAYQTGISPRGSVVIRLGDTCLMLESSDLEHLANTLDSMRESVRRAIDKMKEDMRKQRSHPTL